MNKTQSDEIQSQDQRDEKGLIDELSKRGIKNVEKFREQLFDVLHRKHNDAVLVKELFPKFKTKSNEHEFLRSLTKDKLVLPAGRGGWNSHSTIIFTKEGRELAREFKLPVLPLVFVSYSHEDGKWKKLLMKHLKVPEQHAHLRAWDDTQIRAGKEWKSEIISAIERANASVLLISADFLASEYIKNEEIPSLFADKSKDVFPILARPCAWRLVKWLSEIQVRSINGKALSECDEPQVEKCFAKITEEIASRL